VLETTRAGLKTLARRSLPEPPDDGFTATRSSSYRAVILGVVLVTLFELPVLHFAVHAWLGAGWLWLHAVIFALHAWTVLWLLGDWRQMQASWHRVDRKGLHVHLGNRFRGRVPCDAIAAVRTGNPDDDDPFETPSGVVRVTPIDTPNVIVVLERPVKLKGVFGIELPAEILWLYVDEPRELVDAVESTCRLG